jgi:hypothetical protein
MVVEMLAALHIYPSVLFIVDENLGDYNTLGNIDIVQSDEQCDPVVFSGQSFLH